MRPMRVVKREKATLLRRRDFDKRRGSFASAGAHKALIARQNASKAHIDNAVLRATGARGQQALIKRGNDFLAHQDMADHKTARFVAATAA